MVYEDTHYSQINVASASRKLLTVDHVSAGLVATYTEAMVAGAIFERMKVPLITLWDSAPELDQLGQYVFGIGVWAPSSSGTAADFALHSLDAKTTVTISTNGEWSLGISEQFRNQFEAGGGRVLAHFEVNPDEADFRSLLLKMKAMKPDVLYAPVSDNIPSFWRQLKQIGFGGPAITSDVLNPEVIANIGVSSEGIYQTQVADPSDLMTGKMIERYRAKYGRDCRQKFIVSQGFDAIRLLAHAMDSAGPDPEKLKEALYTVRDLEGASGRISISAEGSARKLVSMFQVRSGQLELVEKGGAGGF